MSDNDDGGRVSAVTFESRMNFTLKSFFSAAPIISQSGSQAGQGGFSADNNRPD